MFELFRKKENLRDRAFMILTLLCAFLPLAAAVGFLILLGGNSAEAFRTFGFGFLVSTQWDPVQELYGALPAISGTLLTTVIALGIAAPLGFITALFLVNAPEWLGHPLSQALDLLAAIPSIIYGMWGLFVLAPVMQDYIQPFLADTLRLGKLPFVGEDYNGFGFLTAGLILALMILPYICAVMRDVFRMTPGPLREAAYGIGCTSWEVASDIVLRYGLRGILGAVFIGLGRALGETMAVLFVIGGIAELPNSLFGSGTTIAATLANNFNEADGLLRSVLFALGLILMLLSLSVQAAAQLYLRNMDRKRGEK